MIMYTYMPTCIHARAHVYAGSRRATLTYASYAGFLGLSSEMLSPPGPAPRVSWPDNYLRVSV